MERRADARRERDPDGPGHERSAEERGEEGHRQEPERVEDDRGEVRGEGRRQRGERRHGAIRGNSSSTSAAKRTSRAPIHGAATTSGDEDRGEAGHDAQRLLLDLRRGLEHAGDEAHGQRRGERRRRDEEHQPSRPRARG